MSISSTITAFTRVAGIALLLASYSFCDAQSHNPNQPTPLGPGTNKGNVDNRSNGPNYYYFHAGPGHVDVRFAFHDMGLYGNPLRQPMFFDAIDEKNQVIGHGQIVAAGTLEKLTLPLNLFRPVKLVIRVSSPQARIVLGGYYEIQVVGAAAFDGKTTGQNVKPVDTSLVHGGGGLLRGGPTTLVGPSSTLVGDAPKR